MGFPFEKLVSKILQHQNYQIKTNLIMHGKCITHEIDILAEKNKQYTVVECKFHNKLGTKSDIKTALYVKARFDDIIALNKQYTQLSCMISTNTQFTSDAILYSECAGIKLLAWGYPLDKGLEILIEEYSFFPITVLSQLQERERKILLKANIVLCQELLDSHDQLDILGIPKKIAAELLQESKEFLHHVKQIIADKMQCKDGKKTPEIKGIA